MTTALNSSDKGWTDMPTSVDGAVVSSTETDNEATSLPVLATTMLSAIPTNSAWLRSASAQGIAGAFVWAAIFITCHQVTKHYY